MTCAAGGNLGGVRLKSLCSGEFPRSRSPNRIDSGKVAENDGRGDTAVESDYNEARFAHENPVGDFQGFARAADDVLARNFPGSTFAERQRFLVARGGDIDAACLKLRSYYEWRVRHARIEVKDAALGGLCGECDLAVWSQAVLAASALGGYAHDLSLPRLIRFDTELQKSVGGCVRARDGTRVVHVLPARLDPTLASTDVYSNAVAIYLDKKLDRSSMEKITVAIDLRGGHGWHNPKPRSFVPFIRHVAQLLGNHFPERLKRCILFPLPSAAKVVFSLIKVFLDPHIVAKIELVTGPAQRSSPPPAEKLGEYFNECTVAALEQNRVSTFAKQTTRVT